MKLLSRFPNRRRRNSGQHQAQGLVEFALILPVLLLLILGSIELARMLAIYSSLSSASRQAARYGSVGGDNGSGTPYFLDCAGIRASARRASVLQALTITDTVVRYDRGRLTDTVGYCDSSNVPRLNGGAVMTSTDLSNGYRVVIAVTAIYRPIVPIVPIPPLPISFVAARTIYNTIAGPTPTPSCPPGAGIVVSAADSSVRANPTSVQADGVETSLITVTLIDSTNSCPVRNKAVTLTSSRGAVDTITVVGGTTNDVGVATFRVASTTSGTSTYTATDTTDGLTITQTATVTFTTDPDATLTQVFVNVPSMIADGLSFAVVTVKIRDVGDRPIRDKIVTLAKLSGPTLSISAIQGTTDASGIATFAVYTDCPNFGIAKFEASTTMNDGSPISFTNDPAQHPTVDFVIGPVSAGISTVDANPEAPATVVADNSTTSLITVTLKNACSQPVANKNVSVATGRAQDTITTIQGTTDGSGQATFRIKSTLAGDATVTATDTSDSITVTDQAIVRFVADRWHTTPSTVNLSTDTIVDDGSSTATITVNLKDVNGNNVPGTLYGTTVTLVKISGPGSTPGPATPDVNGNAVFSITADSTGTAQYEVHADTGSPDNTTDVVGTPPVTINVFTSGVVPALSSISATSPVIANGTSASSVTITLKNGAGNPRTVGIPVTLSSSRGITDTISLPNPATTNGSGIATFTVKSLKVGTPTMTASFTDTTGSCTGGCTLTAPIIFISPVNAANSTVVTTPAYPPTTRANDGTQFFTVTVTLKDGASLPVSGRTVTLSGTNGVAVTTVQGTSDASGVAKFRVTSTSVVVSVLTAVGDGVTLSQTPSIKFVKPVSAATSTVTASPSAPTQRAANGDAKFTITVTLKATDGTLIDGKTVTISAAPAGATITTIQGTTDASGVATFEVRSTTANTYTITATDTTDGITLNTIPAQHQPTITFANLCVAGTAGASAGGDTFVQWTFANATGSTYRLDSITLVRDAAASGGNKRVTTIVFNGTQIYVFDNPDDNNGASITVSTFSGAATVRDVADGVSGIVLRINLNGANAGNYDLTTQWKFIPTSATCNNGPVRVPHP